MHTKRTKIYFNDDILEKLLDIGYSYRCCKERNSSVQINLLKASTTLLRELVLKKLIRISRKERFRLCSSCEAFCRLWHLKTRTRTYRGETDEVDEDGSSISAERKGANEDERIPELLAEATYVGVCHQNDLIK